MDPTLVLVVGGGLGLLLLVVGVVVSLVGGGSVVEERLGRYAETGGLVTTGQEESADARERPTPLSDFLNRMGEGTDLFASLSKNLAQADIKLRPAEYLAAVAGCAAAGPFVVFFLGGGIGVAFVRGAWGPFFPKFLGGGARGPRLKKFDR